MYRNKNKHKDQLQQQVNSIVRILKNSINNICTLLRNLFIKKLSCP